MLMGYCIYVKLFNRCLIKWIYTLLLFLSPLGFYLHVIASYIYVFD